MVKLAIFATIAALAVTRTTAKDSCGLVDFAAKTSEFKDLNAAIDLAVAADEVASMLGKYDPLVLSNVPLGDFTFNLLGQDLTISPTIDSLNITGLTTIIPQHVNVTSSNSVDVGAYSEGQVSVDATLTVKINELDVSATAHVLLGLDKPTLKTNVEANVYACAPGLSCSNMNITEIETELVKAAAGGSYGSIVSKVLKKFMDASVKSVTLDFASVSPFVITFDSSSSAFSSLTKQLSNYSAAKINTKGDVYDTVVSTINDGVLGLLNNLIDAKLKSLFGATCLSEK